MYEQIERNRLRTWLLVTLFLIACIGYGYWLIQIHLQLGADIGNDTSLFDSSIRLTSSTTVSIGLILLFMVILLLFASYYWGDKLILKTIRANRIGFNISSKYAKVVEEMCLASGIPKPSLYWLEEDSINAIAIGRSPDKASIAITRGALEYLSDEELKALIAHELSRIESLTARVGTLLSTISGFQECLAVLVYYWCFQGRKDVEVNGKKIVDSVYTVVIYSISFSLYGFIFFFYEELALFYFMTMLIAVRLGMVTLVGVNKIIDRFLPEAQDFLLDARTIQITRYPRGFTDLLKKISSSSNWVGRATPNISNLFFVSPYNKSEGTPEDEKFRPKPGERIRYIESLISAHPKAQG